jgi:hypothetical protein
MPRINIVFFKMALPVTRSSISTLDKQRLVSAHANGDDYILLATQLQIKPNTAYKIVQRSIARNGVVELPRGGTTNSKVDQEMMVVVEDIIEANPLVTLKTINILLRQRLPHKPVVSDQTVSNICDALLFTVKRIQLHSINRNSASVKEERIVYANWFLQNAILTPILVFVDECGYNMWTSRGQGRSRCGVPATKVVCGQRGNNVSLLLAISPHLGVVHYEFVHSSTTKVHFQAFINTVVNYLPVGAGESCIIMDNAPIHNGVVSPQENAALKHLPPYSSPLNPIEEAFACWKSAVKSKLSEPEVHAMVSDFQLAAAAGMNMHQWRIHHLVNIGSSCIPVITHEKCQRFFNRSVAFLHRCLNSEDI